MSIESVAVGKFVDAWWSMRGAAVIAATGTGIATAMMIADMPTIIVARILIADGSNVKFSGVE
jgi:hypothetical protein